MINLRLACCAGLIALGMISQGAAQQPIQQYQSPYGPTLAPELNYFRRDVGVLSNYQTFVRPQRQLRSTLRGLQYSVDRQGSAIRDIQNGAAPPQTGTHAGYFNYSHYYSFPGRRR